MTILFSHNTARRYWEFVGVSGRHGVVGGDSVLRKASGRKSAIERCGIDLPGDEGRGPEWLARPVDLMVPTAGSRSKDPAVSNHVCAAGLPPSSVNRIAEDAYVTSPELTFVNLGRTLGVPALAEYAMELCGRYAVTPWRECGFEPRASLCDACGFEEFARGCGGVHGMRRAIEAMGIAGEGSRSPAETTIYLLLSMPREMFGYGLPRPLLNQRIDLAPTAQTRLRREYLLVDLLFADERLVVEYDSRAFHNAPAKLDSDDDRREVLQDMGYEVVVVRAGRLWNFRRFDDLVRFTIGKRLGIEVPPMDPRFARGVQNLREDLALASGACS